MFRFLRFIRCTPNSLFARPCHGGPVTVAGRLSCRAVTGISADPPGVQMEPDAARWFGFLFLRHGAQGHGQLADMLARDVATAIAWLTIAGDLKDMRKQLFSTGTKRQLA